MCKGGPDLGSGDEKERHRLGSVLQVESTGLIDQLEVEREGKDKNVRDF